MLMIAAEGQEVSQRRIVTCSATVGYDAEVPPSPCTYLLFEKPRVDLVAPMGLSRLRVRLPQVAMGLPSHWRSRHSELILWQIRATFL